MMGYNIDGTSSIDAEAKCLETSEIRYEFQTSTSVGGTREQLKYFKVSCVRWHARVDEIGLQCLAEA